MPPKAILIDSREPEWVQALPFDGALKMVTALEFGDVWLTTEDDTLVCIERKTPADLLGSIKDNRLFAQCAGMRSKTPWAYLIITGPLTADRTGKIIADGRPTGWEFASVQGALLTCQEYGVSVVMCQSDADYEATVLRIANRKRDKERILEPNSQPRLMTHAESLLTSLPGIGPERATDLLKKFDRSADALTWLTWQDTILAVAGIGKGTKSAVRKALGLADDEELFVMTPPDYANASAAHTNGKKAEPLFTEKPLNRDPADSTMIWA